MSATGTNNRIVLAGKLLLGLVLLVGIAVLAGDLWPNGESPGFMDVEVAQDGAAGEENGAGTTGETAVSSLTAFEQAEQAGAVLGLGTAVDPIKLYEHPAAGATLAKTFPKNGEHEVLTTFYAMDEAVDDLGRTWYQVQLPVPPNGQTAWLKAEDVEAFEIPYRLEIHLADFRLDVLERGELIASYPIGLGTEETPTPLGQYYVTTKMRPPSPGGVYGALAIGVSAFSEQLTDWPGGGQVGIHGTNDPEGSIGKRVSSGCIRLQDENILDLTHFAPLGTPVLIAE